MVASRTGSTVIAGVVAAALGLPAVAYAADGQGSAAHPFKVGQRHKIDSKWGVKTISAVRDADAAIASANMFNDKAPRGRQYVMVKVGGRALSGTDRNLLWDEEFQLLSTHSHTLYGTASEVAPHDLMDQDNVNRGGREAGNIVFAVRKTDLSQGRLLLRVSPGFSLSNRSKYFKI